MTFTYRCFYCWNKNGVLKAAQTLFLWDTKHSKHLPVPCRELGLAATTGRRHRGDSWWPCCQMWWCWPPMRSAVLLQTPSLLDGTYGPPCPVWLRIDSVKREKCLVVSTNRHFLNDLNRHEKKSPLSILLPPSSLGLVWRCRGISPPLPSSVVEVKGHFLWPGLGPSGREVFSWTL